MAEDPIDLDALLAPFDGGEGGAGEDPRADHASTSPYRRLRDARRAARAAERARDEGPRLQEDGSPAEENPDPPPPPEWADVSRLAQEILRGQGKDFEVAAWLTEALVRHHRDGLVGLRQGALLIAGLCDTYWDGGFPAPDEDEPEESQMDGRAAPIGGLAGGGSDGTLMQPLRRMALFHRADGTRLGLYLWDRAEQTETIADEALKQAQRDRGVPALAALEIEAALDIVKDQGGRKHTSLVLEQARAALDAWRAMEQALDARFGNRAPTTRNVSVLLERMIQVTTRLGGDAAGPAGAAPPASLASEGAPPAATPGAGPTTPVHQAATAPGAIRTREDALRELGRIAEYFRLTEPHSPLAYTLAEAVRRGRMTLPELLAEIIPDQEARDAMLSRLGIRPLDSD